MHNDNFCVCQTYSEHPLHLPAPLKASLFTLVALTFITPAWGASPIIGRASVIDGDTIEIRGQRVRLWGIDTPEGQQTCRNEVGKTYRCGKEAADALDELLEAGRPTRCAPVNVDRYGRTVARCTAGRQDVADALVRRGLAVDYPAFSRGKYAPAERDARAAKRGLWRGTFLKPWEWRRSR
ncbi:thermonuclease family protein [Terrihabitans sp. B22-R8]|uniref:thermonuclease family protein n=1 Tax=Terrihabitans sp. B22-R8 TaxID=3425128 RepID=UPI00403C42B2